MATKITYPEPIKIDLAKFFDTIKKSKRIISWLVLHCHAGWNTDKNSSLHATWRSLKWKNPGYHFVFDADGTVWLFNSIDNISNGVAGHNANSIHLSYKGGIEKTKEGKIIAKDTRTEAQKQSLAKVLQGLKKLHPNATIRGHRDFSPDRNKNGRIDKWEYIKECPCFDAIPEYQHIKP